MYWTSKQLCRLMICNYQGNLLIYRFLRLTLSCIHGIQIGLRNNVYQHIFSFPSQASPLQFVWNPESEALFLCFSTVHHNRNWVPDHKNFKQQKDGNDRTQTIPMSNNYFSSPTGKTKSKVLGQKKEVWTTWDIPPHFSVFIWIMEGYSSISKSRLSS